MKITGEFMLPLVYDGIKIVCGYRLDKLVNRSISKERGGRYWKVNLMKDGIHRIVNPAFNPSRSEIKLECKS
jgi:hypothetical protein